MNTKTKSEAALDLLRACWSKRRASKSLLYLCAGWSLKQQSIPTIWRPPKSGKRSGSEREMRCWSGRGRSVRCARDSE